MGDVYGMWLVMLERTTEATLAVQLSLRGDTDGVYSVLSEVLEVLLGRLNLPSLA